MTHEPVPHADRDHSEEPTVDLLAALQASLDRARQDRRRYAQCDETCTTDCGHCKGDHSHLLDRDAAPAPDGEPGTSREQDAREEREGRYEEVLIEHRIVNVFDNRYRCEAEDCNFDTEDWTSWEEHVAPHLVAVADAEQAELRAEIERWREKAQEAGAAYANANSKHHAELDRANRLERLADTMAGKAVDLEDRARAAEADRDRLAGIVEQVRALADDLDHNDCSCECCREDETPHALRAILDGAQTSQSTPSAPETGAGAPGSASGGRETSEALRGAQGGEGHWLIRYDPDDGLPFGEVCRCDIGEDHDAAEGGEER